MPYTTCNGVSQLEALIGDQGDVALIISCDSDKMTGHIESYTPIPMTRPDSISFNPLSYVSSPSNSPDSDSPLLSSFTVVMSKFSSNLSRNGFEPELNRKFGSGSG